ncbi:uncharacterized protein SPSK_10067 [Sporothrix schenckii 1099-18]|uniref:Uncharacterized protein n=1 Tax=Sporothrix schenckii 1099-18 TaxID=1397361 RepID=A0A0F2M671_SPOSC|nr:uncharacterized protein SPSK_10067 [Sporothrix schenckii 1099-18]KJR85193.1 hypothetical protein SPSK_10067 [Sporothrix schenckii 1099-18]
MMERNGTEVCRENDRFRLAVVVVTRWDGARVPYDEASGVHKKNPPQKARFEERAEKLCGRDPRAQAQIQFADGACRIRAGVTEAPCGASVDEGPGGWRWKEETGSTEREIDVRRT